MPSSYPPALRNRFFILHLKSMGWEPAVLTVEPSYLGHATDPLMNEMLPHDLEIRRTKAFSLGWTRKIGIGDLGIRSYCHLLREARKLCREKKPDLIFISGPPWYTLLIGAQIKREFHIPYVMDYIDPWVTSYGIKVSPFKKRYWAEALARQLDPIAVRNADAIVSVSDGINQMLKNFYPDHAHKFAAVIPYGIEPPDFDFAMKHPSPNTYFVSGENVRHFCYVGVIWKELYPVLDVFFSAMQALKQDHPNEFSSTRWHFIGTSYAPDAPPQALPIAKKYGVEEVVSEIPERVSYPNAINLLLQTDVILALGSPDPTYTASKIFPCILAKKPILALFHERNSAVRFLENSGTGQAITFSDSVSLGQKKNAVKERIREYIAKTNFAVRVDEKVFEEYSAKSMTKKLVAVFESAIKNRL